MYVIVVGGGGDEDDSGSGKSRAVGSVYLAQVEHLN